MFQGRVMRKIIGGSVALFGVLMMIGIGGAVEAGTVTIGQAFFRMIMSCVLILIGAAGGLE